MAAVGSSSTVTEVELSSVHTHSHSLSPTQRGLGRPVRDSGALEQPLLCSCLGSKCREHQPEGRGEWKSHVVNDYILSSHQWRPPSGVQMSTFQSSIGIHLSKYFLDQILAYTNNLLLKIIGIYRHQRTETYWAAMCKIQSKFLILFWTSFRSPLLLSTNLHFLNRQEPVTTVQYFIDTSHDSQCLWPTKKPQVTCTVFLTWRASVFITGWCYTEFMRRDGTWYVKTRRDFNMT